MSDAEAVRRPGPGQYLLGETEAERDEWSEARRTLETRHMQAKNDILAKIRTECSDQSTSMDYSGNIQALAIAYQHLGHTP